MMLFDSEYAIYAEYLKSAIKLFKAGKKYVKVEGFIPTVRQWRYHINARSLL